MGKLMNELVKDKENYMQELSKRIAGKKYIVIYGAGRKGMGLFHFLLNEEIKVDAFCVTSMLENKKYECGLQVYPLKELPFDKNDVLILIGVRKRWNEEIVHNLQEHGFENYMIAPDGIEYFAETDLIYNQKPVLQITAQIGCGINCVYCPQEVFVKKYMENKTAVRKLTLDMYIRYLKNVDKDVIIDFAGYSEIFLNPEGIKMIEYAVEEGYTVELYTTLVGLDLDGFSKIKDLPFREVVLHIPDRENNSKIQVTPQYLQLLKETLTATNQSMDNKLWVDWASCHGEPASEIEELVRGRIRTITKLHDRAGNLKQAELEKKEIPAGEKILCTKAENLNHNVLLPDGTVLLCDSDWGMEHPIGNLKDMLYKEMLEGKDIQEVKNKMSGMLSGNLLCRKCCYAVGYKEEEK